MLVWQSSKGSEVFLELPELEYCFFVRMSAVANRLYRAVLKAVGLSDGKQLGSQTSCCYTEHIL